MNILSALKRKRVGAARRRPTRGLRFESLEARQLLSTLPVVDGTALSPVVPQSAAQVVALAEPVYDYTGVCSKDLVPWHDVTNFHHEVILIAGLQPGDKVFASLSIYYGFHYPDVARVQATMGGQTPEWHYYPPDNPGLSAGHSEGLISFTEIGTSEALKIDWWNVHPDDLVHVDVSYRRLHLSNLTAVAPSMKAGEEVTYGCRTTSEVTAKSTAPVAVQLWYARQTATGWERMTWIAEQNIGTAPASSQQFSVPWNQLPPAPAGATHLLTVVDPDGNLFETDEGDNLAAALLPNLGAVSLQQIGDRSVQVNYRWTDPQSALASANYGVWVWWAKGPTLPDRLGDPNLPIKRQKIPAGTQGQQSLIIPAELLDNRPADASYLVAAVDPYQHLPESNEADNVQALAIPNLAIRALQWDGLGGADFTYTKYLAAWENCKPQIVAYWATGKEWSNVVGSPVGAWDLGQGTIRRTLNIGADKLAKIPQNARYLIVAVDMEKSNTKGQILESNEADNYRAIAISDAKFSITSFAWNKGLGRTTGNLEVNVKLDGGCVRQGGSAELHVYWATGVTEGDIIDHSEPIYSASVPIVLGENKFTIPLTMLSDPPMAAAPLRLLAVLDATDFAGAQTTVVKDSGTDGLDPAKVSYELVDIAPTASTRFERVRLWLSQWSRTILRYADTFNVDPRAIAGAVAWESLLNVRHYPVLHPYGPGKVHVGGVNASWVEGTEGAARYGAAIPNYLTLLPGLDILSRWPQLKDPETAIKYIAAILNAFSVDAEKSRDPRLARIRSNPGLLTTFYNGVTSKYGKTAGRHVDLSNFRQYLRDKPQTAAYAVNTSMGQWVRNNIDYLYSSFSPPTNLAVEFEPPDMGSFVDEVRQENTDDNTVEFTGTVRWIDLEGGFYGIVGDDGRNYDPQGLATELAHEGQRLHVIAAVCKDASTFRLWGSEIEILDIQSLAPPIPIAPSNLRASVGTRAVELTWKDNATTETGCRIAISRDGGATWDNVGVVGVNAANFRLENLQPGTRYLFKVRAANGTVYSDYTNTVDVTTALEVPTAPTNLQAKAGTRTVDLTWQDNANNETGCRIAISRDGGATWDNVGVVGANATSFRVESLQPGTRYLFKVRAANGTVYSDHTNTADVTTAQEIPAAPTDLQAKAGPRTVDLTWKENANNETGYRIAVSRDGGATWDNVGGVGANAASFRVENVQPGTRYLFKVRAANGTVYSDYTNTADVTTLVEIPTRPTNLRANTGTRAVDLTWRDNASNETGYRIAISRDGGATWDNVGVVGANATSFRVENLKPGTRYLFKVRAVKDTVFSDYSDILDIRTNR